MGSTFQLAIFHILNTILSPCHFLVGSGWTEYFGLFTNQIKSYLNYVYWWYSLNWKQSAQPLTLWSQQPPTPQLTELPELLVGADSMTSQMTSTARKVDFSEGGVSLLGLGFRQARRLWEAVPWPLSQLGVWIRLTLPKNSVSLGWKARSNMIF